MELAKPVLEQASEWCKPEATRAADDPDLRAKLEDAIADRRSKLEQNFARPSRCS